MLTAVLSKLELRCLIFILSVVALGGLRMDFISTDLRPFLLSDYYALLSSFSYCSSFILFLLVMSLRAFYYFKVADFSLRFLSRRRDTVYICNCLTLRIYFSFLTISYNGKFLNIADFVSLKY